MKIKKLSVSFEARLDVDGRGFSYVSDDRLSGVSSQYASAKGVAELRSGLEAAVNTGLDLLKNPTRRVLMTRAGEVFVVERRFQGWQYSICGGDRSFASSCCGDWTSLEGCADSARKHAESGFGGVLWEHSL